MNQKLKEKVKESLSAVLPITGIVLVLSVTLVVLEVGIAVLFLAGAVMLIIGMGMFQLGAEMLMSTLGEGIGGYLSKAKSIVLIGAVSMVMGILITIAEPDLQVLSNQVPAVPNSTMIWTVAIGVGIHRNSQRRYHARCASCICRRTAALLQRSLCVAAAGDRVVHRVSADQPQIP